MALLSMIVADMWQLRGILVTFVAFSWQSRGVLMALSWHTRGSLVARGLFAFVLRDNCPCAMRARVACVGLRGACTICCARPPQLQSVGTDLFMRKQLHEAQTLHAFSLVKALLAEIPLG